MLRLRRVAVVALLALVIPTTAHAEKVRIHGGGFQFLHSPVNPEAPDGFCAYSPGLLFSVTSESFDGVLATTDGEIPFIGTGDASGCAYLEPVFGVAATFTGSFAWQTSAGELRGTFLLFDFPTEFEGVFEAFTFIKFTGGTGTFTGAKGFALAEGFDFPFGGINGDPNAAGVVAEVTYGVLQLEDN